MDGEEELWAGKRQPLVVMPGLPGCSPEGLSLCPKGNREPWRNICSDEMMQSVLWLGGIDLSLPAPVSMYPCVNL